MSKPPTEPQVDADGRIWADEGPSHYLIHILPDGNEWRQLESNAAWQINEMAEERSLRERDPKDGFVVRSDTHEAVYYYKSGEGYQEGWTENDPDQAQRRKESYERGEAVIQRPTDTG